jgi:membrane-bound metal-dependent hydrolase YbcI (DUF457 family)
MYAIGHFALGYLTGKGTAKLANVKAHVALLLAVSVLPDVDLLLSFLTHRGPTHSFFTLTALMIPFFVLYRKQTLPYYAGLLSHVFIGDFFTGGVQLFWPLSNNTIGVFNLSVCSLTNVVVELVLFAVTVPLMYKTGDLQKLLKPKNMNWALIVPLGAVIGPLVAFGRGVDEFNLPALLVVPSLFYTALFAYSLFVEFKSGDTTHLEETKLKTQSVFVNYFRTIKKGWIEFFSCVLVALA